MAGNRRPRDNRPAGRARIHHHAKLPAMAVPGASQMAYRASVSLRNNETDRGFAAYVRAARKDRGWTQEDLADHSGVGVRTIIRWERGEVTEPDIASLHAAVDTLGAERVHAYIALGWLPPEQELYEMLTGREPIPQHWADAIAAIIRLKDLPAAKRLRGIVELLDLDVPEEELERDVG